MKRDLVLVRRILLTAVSAAVSVLEQCRSNW